MARYYSKARSLGLVLLKPLIISLLFFLSSAQLIQIDLGFDMGVSLELGVGGSLQNKLDVHVPQVRHANIAAAIPAPAATAGEGEERAHSVGRPTMSCPIYRVVKVGAGCVDGLVTTIHKRNLNGLLSGGGRADSVNSPAVADPVLVKQCCPVLGADLDVASDCLCTSLKLKALDLKAYVPLADNLLASCHENTTPTTIATTPKFTC